MFLAPDPKQLHRDGVPKPAGPPAEEAVEKPISTADKPEAQGQGDARLIDHVHFEDAAHETFSEEFCVPSTAHSSKTKHAKRAKDEGDIKREDLECLCQTILTQEERKGYWEVAPEMWKDEPLVMFEFGTVAFVVQCEERKLVRISANDVVAMLGPCLNSHPENSAVKKSTAAWTSHTDSDKADFKWEIRGPTKAEGCHKARNSLHRRAKSLFKIRGQSQ